MRPPSREGDQVSAGLLPLYGMSHTALELKVSSLTTSNASDH